MTHKMEAWTRIREAIEEIELAADALSSFEMSEDEQDEQVSTIKAAAQKVREAAHDYIKPQLP